MVSCTLGFEGAALKAAVEQLEEKRRRKRSCSLLTWMGSMMRSRKDVEEDSWQWAGGSTVLGHVTCSA